jgi:hypothetical protein
MRFLPDCRQKIIGIQLKCKVMDKNIRIHQEPYVYNTAN